VETPAIFICANMCDKILCSSYVTKVTNLNTLFYLPYSKLKFMKKNMGSTDRIIRILLAVVVSVLYFTNTITGTFGIVMLVIAGIFLATSLVSFCPLYSLIGLNTCATKK
jgi:fatty acid desaturase